MQINTMQQPMVQSVF